MCLTMISCNSDKEIIELLNSKNKDEIILGANKAGTSGKLKFVPYILNNAEDWRMSTNFSFKGVTVYKAKMEALQKILKERSPTEITFKPDSTIIKFYTSIYEQTKKE